MQSCILHAGDSARYSLSLLPFLGIDIPFSQLCNSDPPPQKHTHTPQGVWIEYLVALRGGVGQGREWEGVDLEGRYRERGGLCQVQERGMVIHAVA